MDSAEALVVDGAIVDDGATVVVENGAAHVVVHGAGVNYAIVGDSDTRVYRKKAYLGASSTNCKCGFGGNREASPNAVTYS